MLHTTRTQVIKRLEDDSVREKLEAMEHNPQLNTQSSYSSNASLYPDGQRPFVQKHIDYLLDHPQLNPDQYLANLRLMLKKRT